MLRLDSPLSNALLSHTQVAWVRCLHAPGWPVESASESLVTLLGRDALSTGMPLRDILHEEDREAVEERLQTLVREPAGSIARLEFRLRSVRDDCLWVKAAFAHGTDECGDGLCALLVDDSANRRALEEVRSNRQRLQLVLEGTHLGIWDWNPQTGDLVFDAIWAELLGHEFHELEPNLQTWESRVHPDDLAACYEDIGRHIRGETSIYQNIHRMRHKDGHWVYILDRGKVTERDADGNAIRFTGTHTDITPQKEAELEAIRATQAKSAFLAKMSHEIRTPLNGILGVLDVLEDTHLEADQQYFAELIRSSGELLLQTLNSVLDISKIEAGEMPIERVEFDLRSTLDQVMALHEQANATPEVALLHSVANDVPDRIIGDPVKFRQVVNNLVSNARKFTERGHVRVTVELEPPRDETEFISVRVEDTGRGIEHIEHIFDAFKQEDESITRTHGGTGLGLTICRELVGLLGGAIGVESEVSKGTTFTVHWPIESVAVEASAVGPSCSILGLEERRDLRVLVAEDNPVNQLVAKAALKSLGIVATVVSNGAEAVEACARAPFDLVLLDIHMPVMDGIEAADRIRAAAAPGRCPRLVAITADIFEENRRACVEAGIVDFLNKPFRRAALASVLEETRPLHDSDRSGAA